MRIEYEEQEKANQSETRYNKAENLSEWWIYC